MKKTCTKQPYSLMPSLRNLYIIVYFNEKMRPLHVTKIALSKEWGQQIYSESGKVVWVEREEKERKIK